MIFYKCMRIAISWRHCLMRERLNERPVAKENGALFRVLLTALKCILDQIQTGFYAAASNPTVGNLIRLPNARSFTGNDLCVTPRLGCVKHSTRTTLWVRVRIQSDHTCSLKRITEVWVALIMPRMMCTWLERCHKSPSAQTTAWGLNELDLLSTWDSRRFPSSILGFTFTSAAIVQVWARTTTPVMCSNGYLTQNWADIN